MSGTFADEFKRVAIPRIEDAIKRGAFQIAVEQAFDAEADAWLSVQATIGLVASRAGSGRLSARIQHDLEDWINRTLLEEVDLAEKRVQRLRTQHAAAEADPARAIKLWDWLVAATAPERQKAMEHVGISLSPAYRAEWNARQAKKHGNLASRRQDVARSAALQALWRRKLEGNAAARAAEAAAAPRASGGGAEP